MEDSLCLKSNPGRAEHTRSVFIWPTSVIRWWAILPMVVETEHSDLICHRWSELPLRIYPGRRFTPEEVFVPVWAQEVRGLSERNSVRTGISRLRTLIEPAPPEWRYILKTEPTFFGGPGAYYFNPETKYCMITRKTPVLLPL